MAIRTDFTAGEVLAAADLNDTFGAKANLASPTFTGTPAAPTAAAGTNTTQLATTAFARAASGLVRVATESFTSASTLNVNGCFTSTYNNYRILLKCNTTASIRYRLAGTDNSASSYYNQFLQGSVSTASAGRATDTSVSVLSGFGFVAIDLYDISVASNTYHTILRVQSATVAEPIMTAWAGTHDVATAYDGFSIIGSSMTGTVRVYGYQNS
jgi:hypothetical protein